MRHIPAIESTQPIAEDAEEPTLVPLDTSLFALRYGSNIPEASCLFRSMTSAERPPDELANVITHGVGLLLSVAAVGYLLRASAGQPSSPIAAVVVHAVRVYAVTLTLMYLSSTLSHLFYETEWRKRFRTLDQACIFLLIAGTYTPFAAMYLNRGWWLGLLVAMWAFAAWGVFRVMQVRDLSQSDKYVFGVMGFLPAISLVELSRQAPGAVIGWIIAGGACYSLGSLFLRLSSSVRYAHAVWHTFVLAGSACHYWAILLAISSLRPAGR